MEHKTIESDSAIKDIEYCKSCPYYFTEKDKHIVFGKGDIICDTVIILKQYNKNLSSFYYELLRKLYRDEFNEELLDKYYVTHLPKCYNYSIQKYSNLDELVKSCLNITITELNTLCKYYKKIIIFDSILSDMLQTCYPNVFNVPIIYASNPTQTERFRLEFKQIMYNDRNMGL